MKKIYTIGYSSFDIDEFTSVLKKNNISCLIDVRSNPSSKYFPDFSKNNLENILISSGILYRHYKNEFGARQKNQRYYTSGYLDFSKFVQSDKFLEGVKKIELGIERNYTFVLMCAEKDPSMCHRNIMIAREFYKKGYQVNNILADGTIETQDDIEKKLVKSYFPHRNQLSFFDIELSWDEMVSKAYDMRNREIGFRDDNEEEEIL